eukprot:scaffold328329_cov15-Prasinocladus_malaysianus.AAC.1
MTKARGCAGTASSDASSECLTVQHCFEQSSCWVQHTSSGNGASVHCHCERRQRILKIGSTTKAPMLGKKRRLASEL